MEELTMGAVSEQAELSGPALADNQSSMTEILGLRTNVARIEHIPEQRGSVNLLIGKDFLPELTYLVVLSVPMRNMWCMMPFSP